MLQAGVEYLSSTPKTVMKAVLGLLVSSVILAICLSIIFQTNLSHPADDWSLVEGFLRIVGAFLYTVAKLWSSSRSTVLDGTLRVPGLLQEVSIIRDEWGIPHIYAQNRHDVLFAQGFVHAQDRLWQMDINRRLATGRLSEIFGEIALSTDRITRTVGFARKAKEDLSQFSESEKLHLTAYMNGVNAYLNSSYFRLPIEYSIIGQTTVEPWTELDSVAFTRILYWQMHKGWAMEVVRQMLVDAVGEERAAELDRSFLGSMPVHIPKAIELMLNMNNDQETFFKHNGGSNAWAISGNRTKTGMPLLSNDVHLATTTPSIWYENHLVEPSLNIAGASIPGLGLVIIGHNTKFAWGVTLANVDSEDLFVEKFINYPDTYEYKGGAKRTKRIDEVIHVKLRTEPHIEHVIETVHGPIVSGVFDFLKGNVSLCSVATRVPSSFGAFVALAEVTNWKSFTKAVQKVYAPSLNIVYADIEGNIGYQLSGLVPIRKEHKGIQPAAGWTGEHDWQGWVPYEEVPRMFNPENGFIVSANNPIVSPDYKWSLGHSFSQAYRAQRLVEVIQSKAVFTVEDSVKLMLDVTTNAGKEFVRRILNVPELSSSSDPDVQLALTIFKQWDGTLGTESVGGTLYHVVKNFTMFNLLEPVLGGNMTMLVLGKGFHPLLRAANEYIGFETTSLFKMLDNSKSWWIQNAGGLQQLLKNSITQGVKWLKQRMGSDSTAWKWGRLHRIQFRHTLGTKSPLDRVFNIGPFPFVGDNDTPNLSGILPGTFDGFLLNPTYKQIVDLSDIRNKAIAVNAPGQSGQLSSSHYSDQVPLYLEGRFHPLLSGPPTDIQKREGTITMSPI